MIKDILKTLKINHYIKNLVLFIPIIFSVNLFNLEKIANSFIIFISFSLMSSAVYVMNDLIDIEQDKKHPLKCKRPIASGKISKITAVLLLIFLINISIVLSLAVAKLCAFVLLLYFILNIFYSLWLKRIFFIDVACIAMGFIFRIVAGCFAIHVLPSPLVILMTFFISMFFTFSKRKMELELTNKKVCRISLEQINVNIINQYILINAILAISFYYTYVLDSATIARAGTRYLYLTSIPFTLIIFQMLFLVSNTRSEDDPIIFIERNTKLKYLAGLYFVVLFVVMIYLR